jgi:hypothetical protein
MAYYADYWAVTGTAGPVLAIGIVFAMPQAVEAARKLRPKSIEQPESLLGRAKLNMTLRYWNVADLQYWSTAAGFTIDAVLLFSALLSLEWRRNALPPGLVTGRCPRSAAPADEFRATRHGCSDTTRSPGDRRATNWVRSKRANSWRRMNRSASMDTRTGRAGRAIPRGLGYTPRRAIAVPVRTIRRGKSCRSRH